MAAEIAERLRVNRLAFSYGWAPRRRPALQSQPPTVAKGTMRTVVAVVSQMGPESPTRAIIPRLSSTARRPARKCVPQRSVWSNSAGRIAAGQAHHHSADGAEQHQGERMGQLFDDGLCRGSGDQHRRDGSDTDDRGHYQRAADIDNGAHEIARKLRANPRVSETRCGSLRVLKRRD